MAAARNSIKIMVDDDDQEPAEETKKEIPKKSVTLVKKAKTSKKETKKVTPKKRTLVKKSITEEIVDNKIDKEENNAAESEKEGATEKKEFVTDTQEKIKKAREAVLTGVGETKIESVKKEEIIKEVAKPSGAVSAEIKAESVTLEDKLMSSKANAVKNLINSSQDATTLDLINLEPKDIKKKEENKEEKPAHHKVSIKLYRKLAVSFVVLTVLLLAVISYFAFAKVVITLIPNQERVSNSLIFDVYDKNKQPNKGENDIIGIVESINIKNEKSFSASGTEVIGQEVVGKVTIINNYDKNQPLVASTRLLSPDGKLYRLKDTVNAPAGGSIEANIYTETAKPEMAIAPTKFTIPGLWAGLQDKIYAESKEAFVYQQKLKKQITQADIDNAERDLKQELLAKVKSDINDKYKEYNQIIYKIDENSIKSEVDSKVGEEKESFKVGISADIIVVAFDDAKAKKLARQKFISSLPENREMLEFDENNIIYALSSFDQIGGTASINSTFEGKVTIKENYNIIEPDKILGLSKTQLDAYLSALPEIAGYEVKFFPSFIKRVPKLVDRIKVEIKK